MLLSIVPAQITFSPGSIDKNLLENFLIDKYHPCNNKYKTKILTSVYLFTGLDYWTGTLDWTTGFYTCCGWLT